MRKLTEIIVHCTGTPPTLATTVDTIRKYHVEVNKWKDIGYHFVVYTDGSVHIGRPLEQVGAHCKVHNEGTIGICYVGGKTADGKLTDTRTAAQKQALRNLVVALKGCYPSIARVRGHRDYANKACPCFDAKSEYADLV